VKDYVYGLYGQPPAPIDPEIQKIVLKGYERGETPITARPGDVLQPELDAAYAATKDIARDTGDVLIYALYPTTGLRFLRWKYGLEAPPPDTRAKTLEDVKREDEAIARAKASVKAAPAADCPPAQTAPKLEQQEKPASPAKSGESHLTAPMPGLIIRLDIKEGDSVKAGDCVAVLEAMKMAIDLPAPTSGKIKKLNCKAGDNVARDAVLVIIEQD
jgi:biotin carboxyl carrier protein